MTGIPGRAPGRYSLPFSLRTVTGAVKFYIPFISVTAVFFSLAASAREQIGKKPGEGAMERPAGARMRIRLDRSLDSNRSRRREELMAIPAGTELQIYLQQPVMVPL